MSRNILSVLLFCMVLLSAGTALAWTDLDGGDHGGADWAPANGTYIAGKHYGIATFSVPSGTTVYVRSHADGYGWLSVHAKNINIQGVINGNYAGYTGGTPGGGGLQRLAGGGEGGDGGTQLYGSGYSGRRGQAGNSGTQSGGESCGRTYYGCGGGGGGPGGGGGYREDGCKSTVTGWAGYGDVCTAGAGGSAGAGGKALPTANKDDAWIPYGTILSNNLDPMYGIVYKGSGGGGGGGPGASGHAAYSGTHNESGGAGGGMIMLWASNNMNMGGSITAQGQAGGNGAPGGSGYYPGCSDCDCNWFGCWDEKCATYYAGGSSIGGGGGSGGGVSIGAASNLNINGSVNITGGNGGSYTGTTPIRTAGKGSGGMVRLHNSSPNCSGACTAVATGTTCSGSTMTAEVWNGGNSSTPAPKAVKFTAEDTPYNYLNLKVKVDGVEYTTDGSNGFTVPMAYGHIYQVDVTLYQTVGSSSYKYMSMKFPDNRQVTGTSLSILYNGGDSFKLTFKNLDNLYWTGMSSALVGSKPQCTVGNNLWSNPCNWADGEGNVLTVPPTSSDDITFTNCAGWPLNFEPRINANAKAQSLMVDQGCNVYWAATGGDLAITNTLQVSGGVWHSPDSSSRLVVGSDFYLEQFSGIKGLFFFDKTQFYVNGNIQLGTLTEFVGGSSGELLLEGATASIANESDSFQVHYMAVAKNADADLNILHDIGKAITGSSDTINYLEIVSGRINLANRKLGVQYRLYMRGSGRIYADNTLARLIVRGHDASITPIHLEGSSSISMQFGSILLQPDVNNMGDPIQVPVDASRIGILLEDDSSLILDNALLSSENNLEDSGWNMSVIDNAVLTLRNSSYLNVDSALTISSPNVTVLSSVITTGYETPGKGTLNLQASGITIDSPTPWTQISSRLWSFGNMNISSPISGQGPEFHIDGSSSRGASINTNQALYKLYILGGQVSFAGTLTVKNRLEIETDGELLLAAGNQLIMQDKAEIQVKGRFTSSGSVGNNAVVTSDASNHYYSFEVLKGEINSILTTFERLDSRGLQIKPDALINPTSALNRCVFRYSNESEPFSMMTVSNAQTVTCNQVTFDYFSGTPDPDQFNVSKINNQGSLTFTNEAGAISGEAWDDDYYNRVNWTLGNPTLSYYDKQDTALNSAQGSIQLSIILTGQPENTEYLIQNWSSSGPHADQYLKSDGTFTSNSATAWGSYLDFGGPDGLSFGAADNTLYRFRVKARPTIGGIPGTPLATWDETQPAVTTLDRTAPSAPGLLSISEDSDSNGKYLNLSWSAVSGAAYVAPMRAKAASGEYWPVNGFFDGFTDFNYTKDPQWVVATGQWETGSQVLTQETGNLTGSIYFQGYNPGINYLYHLKAMKITGTHGVHIPFLYRGAYPCWRIGQNVSGLFTSSVQGLSSATSKEFNMNLSQWYDIKILVLADRAFGYIDNKLMWSAGASDPQPTSGSYLFTGLAVSSTQAYFDDVTLKPLVPNMRASLSDLEARDREAPNAPVFGLSNVAAASFKTLRISWDSIVDQGTAYSYHLDAIDEIGNYSSGSDNAATVTEGFGEVVARARVNDEQPDIDANYDNGLATSSGTFADMNVAGTKPGNAFRAVRIQVCDAKATNRNCTDWLGRAACAVNSDCTGYTGTINCNLLQCDYNTRPPGIPRYTLATIPGNDASNNYPLGVAPTAIIKTGSDLDEDSIWVQFNEGANTAGTQFAVAWHSASQSEDCASAQSNQGWISTSYNPLYGYGSSPTEAWFASTYWSFDDDSVGSTGLDPSLYYCFAVKARNAENIETPLTPWSVPVRPPYKPRVQSIIFGKGQESLGKPMLKVNGADGVSPSGDLQTARIVIEDKSGAADITSVLVRITQRASQDPNWTGGRGYFEWNRDTGVFRERLNNQNLGGNKFVAVDPLQCSKTEAGNSFTITFAWVALAGPDWYDDIQDNGISVLIQDASGISTNWTENQYGESIDEIAYTFHVSSQPGEPQPHLPGADSVDFWTNDRTPTLTLVGAQDPNKTVNWSDSGDNVFYKFRVVDKPYCDGSNGTATVIESDYIDVGNATAALSATWDVSSNLAAGRYFWCGRAKDQHDYGIEAGVQPWERNTSNIKARMIGIDFRAPMIPSLTAYTDNPADSGTSVAPAPAWIFDRTLYFQWGEQQPQSDEPSDSTSRAPFKQYWYKLTNHFEGITPADTYPYPNGSATTNLFRDFTTGEGVGYGIKYFCVVGEDMAGNISGFSTKTALCLKIQIDLENIAAPLLTSASHVDEALVYCTDTSIDGSSVIPNTIPNAYEPEFTIADPPTYSGIYGYSFSVFARAGQTPDKCNSVSACAVWGGFEDTLDPGLLGDKCNLNTLLCTDSNLASSSTYNFKYAPSSATVSDLQHSWKYNLDVGGTYYVAVTAYTIAGKWSAVDEYRYNICACEGNDCKDYNNRQSKLAGMVDFSGGKIYAPGSSSLRFARGIEAQIIEVAPFSIDAAEVSNEQYLACVADGGCDEPSDDGVSSRTRKDYLYDDKYKEFPALNITWDMAQQYCNWAGKRLPSEVEWEFAAQNSFTGFDNVGLTRKYVNDLYEIGDTVSVYENHGPTLNCRNNLYNMFNNVSEWVSDWYAPYEAIDYSALPSGPESMELCRDACLAQSTDIEITAAPVKSEGQRSTRKDCYSECYRKVVRGGSFEYESVYGSIRQASSPDSYSDSIGFRCAMDAEEAFEEAVDEGRKSVNQLRTDIRKVSSNSEALRR